jgi:hypothetical protein
MVTVGISGDGLMMLRLVRLTGLGCGFFREAFSGHQTRKPFGY